MLSDMVRAWMSLVRVGAETSARLVGWSVQSGAAITSSVVESTRRGEPPTQAVQHAIDELRQRGRELLGIENHGRPPTAARSTIRADEASLRRRGTELLRQSVDLDYTEPVHPAYARILDLMAPDEARILRLLVTEGPQPAVDVRAADEVVAPGISLVADHAGCRFPDRLPIYLSNLHQLGLIWFSREPLPDDRYRMLEAQPPVQKALNQARRTKTIRRRIELTPFGTDFAQVCLPLDTY